MKPGGRGVVDQRHRLGSVGHVATCIRGRPRDEQASGRTGFRQGVQGPCQGDVRTGVFRMSSIQHEGGAALLGGRSRDRRERRRHGVEDRQGLGRFCLIAGFVGGDVRAGPHARTKTFPLTPKRRARPSGRAASVFHLGMGWGKAVGASHDEVLGDEREDRGRGVDDSQRFHQGGRIQTFVRGNVGEVQCPQAVHPQGVHRGRVGHVATAVLSGRHLFWPRCHTRQGPREGGRVEHRRHGVEHGNVLHDKGVVACGVGGLKCPGPDARAAAIAGAPIVGQPLHDDSLAAVVRGLRQDHGNGRSALHA